MSKLKKSSKQPSMNDDLAKYPKFILVKNKGLIPADYIKTTNDYNHYEIQAHHFIEKTIRKNDPEFYERVEYLQKIIFVPPKVNYEIATLSDKRFFDEWGIDKSQVLFNRKKWRENYYE